MVDLGLINSGSPLFPGEVKTEVVDNSHSSSHMADSKKEANNDGVCGICSCPLREGAPEHPRVLPFEPNPENVDQMKKWRLDKFASSKFNTCPHHSLPELSGPEVQIHVDNNAKPKACHTPASIPIHWQEKVHADLLRDEALMSSLWSSAIAWC